MKKTASLNTSWMVTVSALVLFVHAPVTFAKPQKKPARSGQENPDPLVNAAMKNMESSVWFRPGGDETKAT
jgi:hypothetical protein